MKKSMTIRKKNKIGFFVEYALDRGDSLTDLFGDSEKQSRARSVFKTGFWRECEYTFLSIQLLRRTNDYLLPVNPYCYNDTTIVKGWLRDKNGRIYDKEHFLDALRRYRSAALKVTRNCVMKLGVV